MAGELMRTGVPGFDEILGGGFPVPTASLLIGGPGTGKSILGLQFLVEGARKFREPGVYITLEETADSLRSSARALGLNTEELEQQGLLKIVEDPQIKHSARLTEFVQKYVSDVKARRVVLDSLTLFQEMQGMDLKASREELLRFINKMREMRVVTLAVAERGYSVIDDIRYTPEDHLFQGVIMMIKLRSRATFERCISVVKVRGIDHSLKVHPFKIGPGGLTIYPDSTPFSLTAGVRDEKRGLD